jgi:DNA polymerase Pol2
MQINFIPIDYDYFDYNGKNYAKIIGRTDKGKKICVIDSCDIYFWAILKKDLTDKQIKKVQEKIENIKVEGKTRTTSVIKTEIHNKNFLGNKVKAIKVFIPNYKDAHDVADQMGFDEIEKRRGYDLNFITLYIIEKKLKPLAWHKIEGEVLSEKDNFNNIDSSMDLEMCIKAEKITSLENKVSVFEPKILAYDIETDDFDAGKGKILMISLVGNDIKKVLTWKKESKKEFVEYFKDEKSMIEAFVKEVKKYDPDILAGYFSDGFDLPYIKERANKLKVSLNLGVDNSQPVFSRGKLLTGKIRGIIHIDIFRFIKTAYSQYLQSETLSLDEVASELLGERKLEFTHKGKSQLHEDQWEDFFDYNLQDSMLTLKLTKKIWLDLVEFSKIIEEPLFKVSRDSMSAHVENYIIHNLDKFNEIPEKQPVHDEIGNRRMREKYEGAFVFQPIPGLYENICFFDFSSMYASVIVTYNLSLSNLTKDKKDSYEAELEGKKVYFSKKTGFFPEMLKEIIKKRREFKQEYNKNPDPLLKVRSNAFKLIANAAYGYQGFFGARYYCLEAAAATAYFARENIKSAIKNFEKEGYKVIYSDTDSVAINLGDKSKSEALSTLKKINDNLPGIMELDLEDFYKRGIWVTKRTGEFGAKKKYALINEKGQIKIRGFETVRRDWCNLARETQNKVLEFILKEGNEKKALEYVKEIIKKLKNREIPLNKLIIKTQLKKTIEEYKSINPHVTIAKKMKERQMPVDVGMIIEYYISESDNKKALVRDRAKLPDEPGKYDLNYYLKNQILPAVENILEVFKINITETIEGRKQAKLGDF